MRRLYRAMQQRGVDEDGYAELLVKDLVDPRVAVARFKLHAARQLLAAQIASGKPPSATEYIERIRHWAHEWNVATEFSRVVLRICEECGREIHVPMRQQVFCSTSCSARARNRGRDRDEDHKSPEQRAIARMTQKLQRHVATCPACKARRGCPRLDAMTAVAAMPADAFARKRIGIDGLKGVLAGEWEPEMLDGDDEMIEHERDGALPVRGLPVARKLR